MLAIAAFSGMAVAQETGHPEINVRTATVSEVQIAGSYAYIMVNENGNEVWLATSPDLIKGIKYGDVIEFVGDLEMQDFHSKGLDRTFESLWFIGRIRIKSNDTA
jgi:hypothetical protein